MDKNKSLSRIPVPSRYNCMSNNLQRSFDQIEDYIDRYNIDFDLFGLSQRPTFHSLMQLVQLLCTNVSVTFGYNAGCTIRQGMIILNELMDSFGVRHSVVEQDLIRLNDVNSLQKVIKAVATLVSNRFVPISSVNDLDHSTRDEERVTAFFDKIRDSTARVSVNLGSLSTEARLANVSLLDIQHFFNQNIEQKQDTVKRLKHDIEVMKLNAEKVKGEMQRDVQFVEQTPELFKNEQLFAQHKADCERKYERLLANYHRLCDAYRSKRLKPAADRMRQLLHQACQMYETGVCQNGSSVSLRAAHDDWQTVRSRCDQLLQQEPVTEERIIAARKLISETVFDHQTKLDQVNASLERNEPLLEQQSTLLKLQQEDAELNAKLERLKFGRDNQ